MNSNPTDGQPQVATSAGLASEPRKCYQLHTYSDHQQLWIVAGEWWPTLERVAVDVLHASIAGYKCRIIEGVYRDEANSQFNQPELH